MVEARVRVDLFSLKVIWALGASMIVLAGLIWLPRAAIITFGAALVLAGATLVALGRPSSPQPHQTTVTR